MLPWLMLYLAIAFEVAGTVCLKLSRGLTLWVPAALSLVCYGISLGVLGRALKGIDVSVAYAIWSGIGMTMIAVIGVVHFREPATLIKLVSLGLVIIGVVGLNLSSTTH